MSVDKFQNAKLRLARLLSGLSKAELASSVSKTRQFMHALETGEKKPTGDLVSALALILKVPTAFFFVPLQDEVREEQCHFRSRRDMPEKIAQQIIAHGTALESIVNQLTKSLKLPNVNFPDIPYKDGGLEEIESTANRCREVWGLGNGPISNMCRVLENAGAVVTYFETQRDEVDALSMARNRPIVVRNTIKASPGRQRFDFAHECGHLVMHGGVETGDKATESQANSFAAAFLMPRESFKKDFPAMEERLDWNIIYSAKIRWRVSAKAVVRRARDLSLLDAVRYESANRYLSGTGQAKTEKYDEKIPLEKPELIAGAIVAYLKTRNISIGEFAGEVGMTPILINQLVPSLKENLDHHKATIAETTKIVKV
jgi:Zn-dependent peptidase ImmA (M78 family)/transcriptional regulator with XRE-family HTH domain